MIVPVILSGGSGTRLWPLSRELHPKQFINLINETSLFQDTIIRLPNFCSSPVIVCNEEHRFLAAEQLREIDKKTSGIILEPEGKNTAPAIALCALKLIASGEDPVMLILSADHLIQNTQTFQQLVKDANKLAENGNLVTFGIFPDKPETGYGYIEADINSTKDYYRIKSFTEKPDHKKATKYLNSGNYLWNSGMFMFRASVYLDELEKFEPKIFSACKQSCAVENIDSDFIRIDRNLFKKCPNKSIDYAVMERTSKGIVVPFNANWRDVGSWSSLWDAKTKDKNDNVIEGDVLIEDVKDTYVLSSNRLVSVVGVSNLVIVDTFDALLVADKKQTKNIKKIVNILHKDKRSEAVNHRKVHRPWGHYDLVDSGEGFQVKRIVVNPKAKLSLQKHKYRAEHWVVVKGVAFVTCDNQTFVLNENQSTYIPKGSFHRLENHQNKPLEIIEIQTGSYLSEDDIIRKEDVYSRK